MSIGRALHRDNRYDRMTDSFQQLVGRALISAAESHAATRPRSRPADPSF